MAEQKPTVGRIVHYQSLGTPGGEHKSAPCAAIVTQVHHDTCVDLCVFYPNGQSFKTSILAGDAGEPGRWSWPPRV